MYRQRLALDPGLSHSNCWGTGKIENAGKAWDETSCGARAHPIGLDCKYVYTCECSAYVQPLTLACGVRVMGMCHRAS